MSEAEYRHRRKVPIHLLPPCSKARVEEHLFGARTARKHGRKQRLRPGPPPLT